MLFWALIFFLIAVIAGGLGLTGLSGAALLVSRILFGIFMLFFIIALIIGLMAMGAATAP